MQAHTVERVEAWSSRPFSGGFRELHDLADADFSGVVVADDTWLFMLNGRVIGVFEGDVEDFEGASGTVYEAPHPSLPLLFSMQERGGETQAKYYTNDTPLSEADGTLSDANFTGFVELSENVLSGDYYVVYYGGRSMSAAFVGASEDLVTGDEAFERADDEVGLYEVRKAPVNVTSLPKVEDDEGEEAAAAAGAATSGAVESGSDESPSEAESAAAESAATESPETDSSTPDASDDEPASAATSDVERETTANDRPAQADRASTDADEPAAANGGSASAPASAGAGAASASSESSASSSESAATDGASAAAPDQEGVFSEEEEWRNARSVPTLDPKRSEDGESEASAQSQQRQQSGSRSERSKAKRSQSNRSRAKRSQSKRSQSGSRKGTVQKLKEAVEKREAKLEEAVERIDALQAEREDLQERVTELQRERDDLQNRVEELEAALEAADEDDATSAGTDLEPGAALSGTNLFVRYHSKGKPTLDELDGETDPEAVNQNLRIDHHTQFDAAEATVGGEAFESFLTSSSAYRFVSWVVRELPFEIRDAGHASGLGDLYQAIPRIDRAELGGTVEVETEEHSVAETFDVVLRDRMGNPLVVAELNDEREPVTGDEMDALVEAASGVREGADDLASAVYVTASFFEPQALETADAETGGGGFLSRTDKESFVKVGRKAGYHLCLVEDRNDAFHLTVPEL